MTALGLANGRRLAKPSRRAGRRARALGRRPHDGVPRGAPGVYSASLSTPSTSSTATGTRLLPAQGPETQ